MNLDARIQVRTSRELKEQATETLESMGMSVPTAINIFLRQVVHEQRLPFQPSLFPYVDAIREAEAEPVVDVNGIDEMMDLIDHA
ncbi:MAG: type II toxin-antitoxin system RelB/DinJ family antitoxin [Propionibacteriaceae bacterium]|uniref:RelB antitoxin/Antitoxin DinJ n=1 Tax=Propionibacterium ruminifibrarum TaxID=1962131 RepID=A0A375I6C3_9ACTN|nr:type II toxin-antitoxin system RelB/DinJ family antitoxin [Propionibacterium ruminifibrarum]MBE6476736.1 type II toxin-antitoxin system RelB/DinJ family antitoxin [Propionibacteriaceae bacterium]SPF69045.1 RelB antitoxin/Antitoxin DinJ [Propionibacterium ruminifibrarum]